MSKVQMLFESKAWLIALDFVPGKAQVVRHRKEKLIVLVADGQPERAFDSMAVTKRIKGRPQVYGSAAPADSTYVALRGGETADGVSRVCMFFLPNGRLAEFGAIFPEEA